MIDDSDGLILIFTDRANAMTIPRHAFADEATADRFVELVQSKIG
jgi:hypothetical protein